MTRDDIIRMAREADLWMTSDERIAAVERFAQLIEDKVRDDIIEKNKPVLQSVNKYIKELQDVVLAEREACAKVCDDLDLSDWQDRGWDQGTYDCANAIRARGQQ